MKKTKLSFLFLTIFLFTHAAFAQVKLDSSLVACYPFNGNANDFSGHNNHGTVYGANLTQDRFGNPNSAYHFNGVSSYIEIQRFDSLVPTDELSTSFWCIVYNGIAAHAQFQAQLDDNSDRFDISIHYNHNGVPSAFWDYGDIDDIRFYNRVITPEEVQALYADNPTCTSSVINELSNSEGIFIYPNPSQGYFNINFKEPFHNSSVKIINTFGKNVYEMFIGSDFKQIIQIVSDKISKGLYFVLVSNEKRQYAQKIVIK